MKRYIRSVAKHYPVRLPDGSYTKFAGSDEITKIVPLAGAGTKTELRVKIFLEAKYRIPQKCWTKYRGESKVYINRKIHRAELHWYEANGRKYEIKVKHDFEEGDD